jgi:hypothetical protein
LTGRGALPVNPGACAGLAQSRRYATLGLRVDWERALALPSGWGLDTILVLLCRALG